MESVLIYWPQDYFFTTGWVPLAQKPLTHLYPVVLNVAQNILVWCKIVYIQLFTYSPNKHVFSHWGCLLHISLWNCTRHLLTISKTGYKDPKLLLLPFEALWPGNTPLCSWVTSPNHTNPFSGLFFPRSSLSLLSFWMVVLLHANLLRSHQ